MSHFHSLLLLRIYRTLFCSETSPDYEPPSPTLSSPGPSISERGGQNSPPRFQKVAKVTPTVYKKFNTRSSTAAAAAASMVAVSPRLVQAVQPTMSSNVKAVAGVKRGHGTVGGPKAKEVKMYRVQPSSSSSNTSTSTKKLNVVSSPKKNAALSNGVRKILINTMDAKDLRTIKIINASTLKNAHLKIAAANLLQQSKQGLLPKNAMLPKEQYEMAVKQEWPDDDELFLDDALTTTTMKTEYDDDVEEDDEDDEDEDDFDRYSSGRPGGPNGTDKLVLTPEEKRLLSKEGITLPQNYPLTKHEERELKRIRRKIRNKISAQDSRKRKKEYVDGLEERVKQCTDENQSLLKRIKMLQGQNQSLMNQMKKLQNLISKNNTNSSSTAQPATCLMVLLLSMALIAAPNLKLGKRDTSAKESELAEAIQESLQQNRRSLLFDNLNTAEDDDMESMVCSENDFIAENENFIENFYNRIGVGGGGNSKKAAAATASVSTVGSNKKASSMFMDLDLDDTIWRAGQTAAAGSSSAFGKSANQNNGPVVDVMDNYLIMELRDNLLNNNHNNNNHGDDNRINNSMRVVHNQQRHTTENILFQD